MSVRIFRFVLSFGLSCQPKLMHQSRLLKTFYLIRERDFFDQNFSRRTASI